MTIVVSKLPWDTKPCGGGDLPLRNTKMHEALRRWVLRRGLRFYMILSAKNREGARRPCGENFYHEEHEGTQSLAAEGCFTIKGDEEARRCTKPCGGGFYEGFGEPAVSQPRGSPRSCIYACHKSRALFMA